MINERAKKWTTEGGVEIRKSVIKEGARRLHFEQIFGILDIHILCIDFWLWNFKIKTLELNEIKWKCGKAILQKESIQSSELSQLIPLNRFLHLTEIIENGFPPQNKGSQTFLKLIFSFGTILIQMKELQMNELE